MDNFEFLHNCTKDTVELEGLCHGLPVCGDCYSTIEFSLDAQPAPPTLYMHWNLAIKGIILPIVGFFGLIGNSLSAFVYSRREMRSSLNVYLGALAFSDFIVALTSYFLFFLLPMRSRVSGANELYAFLAPIVFPMALTAQSLSVFLTVAAAADCLLLVRASHAIKTRWCSIQRSKKMVAIIALCACAFNTPHFFEIRVHDCWSVEFWRPSRDVCPTELRKNELYTLLYYAIAYSLFMAAGPFVLLIAMNSAILHALKKRTALPVDSEIKTETVDGETKRSDGVMTLILVVCLFVACNFLPLTLNVLELLGYRENAYLVDVSNLMVVLNSSCNFLIYYKFGTKFRSVLQDRMKKIPICIRRILGRRKGHGNANYDPYYSPVTL